ncbi:MAG: formate/nitrite transporter family protein [Burkholderiales bacterium]
MRHYRVQSKEAGPQPGGEGLMAEVYGFDAYAPKEIARRVEEIGVAKARLPLLQMVMLGILAGAFIGLGALYYVIVASDASLGFAVKRVLGGVCFSLGLLLVVVAGAELFTGNNLLAMAWADGRLSTGEVLRNWLIVCIANLIGAAGLALIVHLSGHTAANGGAVARTVIEISTAKAGLSFQEAFFRGVLCNLLVCMALWMALAGRTVTDKAVAIVLPVSAFVAAGFEHSIANMYLYPLALLIQADAVRVPGAPFLSLGAAAASFVPVIAGNLVGGSVLVALVYHLIYRRGAGGAPPAQD